MTRRREAKSAPSVCGGFARYFHSDFVPEELSGAVESHRREFAGGVDHGSEEGLAADDGAPGVAPPLSHWKDRTVLVWSQGEGGPGLDGTGWPPVNVSMVLVPTTPGCVNPGVL